MFLVVGCLFIIFLIVAMIYRSSDRRSVMSTEVGKGDTSETPSGLGSVVHIQDFHRVEVKDGIPQWEVWARDARYFTREGISHLDDVLMIVYRRDGSRLRLEAKAARVSLVDGAIKQVEVHGDVKVSLPGNALINCQDATFEQATNLVEAPGDVRVDGEGYVIHSVGMRADLATKEVSFLGSVKSRFDLDGKARVPNLGSLPIRR